VESVPVLLPRRITNPYELLTTWATAESLHSKGKCSCLKADVRIQKRHERNESIFKSCDERRRGMLSWWGLAAFSCDRFVLVLNSECVFRSGAWALEDVCCTALHFKDWKWRKEKKRGKPRLFPICSNPSLCPSVSPSLLHTHTHARTHYSYSVNVSHPTCRLLLQDK